MEKFGLVFESRYLNSFTDKTRFNLNESNMKALVFNFGNYWNTENLFRKVMILLMIVFLEMGFTANLQAGYVHNERAIIHSGHVFASPARVIVEHRYYTPFHYGYVGVPLGYYHPCVHAIVPYPAIGCCINVLPAGYVSLYVGGIPYYYYGGTYYRWNHNRYVAVARPARAVFPQGKRI